MSKKRCDHRPSTRRPARTSFPFMLTSGRTAGRPSTPPPALRAPDDEAAARRAALADACALGADPDRAAALTEAVWRAWDAVPEACFVGAPRRVVASALAQGGWFGRVVHACAEGRGPDGVVACALADRSLLRLVGFRAVVLRWAEPLRRAPARAEVPCADALGEDDAPSVSMGRDVRRLKGSALHLMLQGEEGAAWAQVHALVAAHRREAHGALRAVISLCDLAARADACGRHAFQLRLTTRAVSMGPEEGGAWLLHAVALRRHGRFEEAALAARRAASLRGDVVTRSALALSLREAGRRDESLAVSEENARRFPHNPHVRLALAETLRELGRLRDALGAFDDALSLGCDARGSCGRGEVLLLLGRPFEALAAFEDVLRARPEHPRARSGHAMAVAALLQRPEIARALTPRR